MQTALPSLLILSLVMFILIGACPVMAQEVPEHSLGVDARALRKDDRWVIEYELETNLPAGAWIILRLESAFGGGVLGHGKTAIEEGKTEGVLGPFQRRLLPGHYKLVAHFNPLDQRRPIWEAVGGRNARAIMGEHAFSLGTDKDMAEVFFLSKVAIYDRLLKVAFLYKEISLEYQKQIEMKEKGEPFDGRSWNQAMDKTVNGAIQEGIKLRHERNNMGGDPMQHAKNSLLSLCRNLAELTAHLYANLFGKELPRPPQVGTEDPEMLPDPKDRLPKDPLDAFVFMFLKVRNLFAMVEIEQEWARFWMLKIESVLTDLEKNLDPLKAEDVTLPAVDLFEEIVEKNKTTLDYLKQGVPEDLFEIPEGTIERRERLGAMTETTIRLHGKISRFPDFNGSDEEKEAERKRLQDEIAKLTEEIEAIRETVKFWREIEEEEKKKKKEQEGDGLGGEKDGGEGQD